MVARWVGWARRPCFKAAQTVSDCVAIACRAPFQRVLLCVCVRASKIPIALGAG